MPDNQRILFGAEFDASDVIEKAQVVTNVFHQLQGAQKTLSDASAAYKTTLKQVADQIAITEKAIASLDKGSKTYQQDLAKLTSVLKTMKDQQAETVKSLADNDDLLIRTTSTLEGYSKSTRDATKSIKEFGAGNTEAREHIGYLHKEIDEVFNRQVRTAIRGAGEALIGGFIGVIIGQALPSMEKLIEKVQEWIIYNGEAGERQKIINDIFDKASKGYGEQAGKLELIKAKLNDLSIPEATRLRILKEYNDTADQANQIDEKQIDNLGIINSKIETSIELLKRRAIARGAEAVVGEKAENLFKAQMNARVNAEKTVANINEFDSKHGLKVNQPAGTPFTPALIGAVIPVIDAKTGKTKMVTITAANIDQFKAGQDKVHQGIMQYQEQSHIDRLIEQDEGVKNARKEFDRALELANKLTPGDGLTAKDSPEKDKKDKKAPENVFEQMLAELRSKLATAMESQFQSEPLIRKKFAEELAKEFQQITELLKKGKLKPDQAIILKNLQVQVNDALLQKSLEDFRKKHQAALDKIDEIINQSNDEHAKNRVNAIRDDLEKEKASIENTYNTTIYALARKLDELTTGILEDKTLTQPEKDQQITLLGQIFTKLIGDADQARINQQLDLAFKVFQDGIKELQRRLNEGDVGVEEQAANRVANVTQKFLAGQMTYKKYQQELTKILKEEKIKRDQLRIDELTQEQRRLENELQKTEDPTNRKKLEDQLTKVKGQIATTRSLADQAAATELNTEKENRLKSFLDYVKGVQDILSAAANFWSQVNAVEQAGIERSLALQAVRVSRAQRIADKGNAEYLEMERKREDQLLQKKEEAARKQLAINQALTLSNATVAAISAIAKASESGSFLNIAAATAAVIGAIAAAFSFVSSLKPVVPTFFEGTEQVTGAGTPAGKDKVPARLHVGERVVTASDNRNYWDALHAIHTHQVPPAALNHFVKNYNRLPELNTSIPRVDFFRLTNATNGKIGADSAELLHKVDRLNSTMERVVNGLGQIGMNVNLDEHGLTASISKVQKAENLRKKA